MLFKDILTEKLIIIFLLLYFLFFKLSLPNIPLVSIIISINNNYNFIYDCLSSINDSESSINHEIIILGNISNNNYNLLKEKLSKNNENIIFLNNIKFNNYILNCNQASKFAKGKYIVFLRNVRKVHKHWLNFLLQIIQTDDKVGMVGSKIIDSNNILQEAGGIVWSNAECENFGRNQKADMPEYNYVKEVDYISGVSIIIKKSIWKKLEGFDERFIPRYYEDTDFAFKLRKNGLKVMYQPKSIVEEYKEISEEKDILEINKIKFIEKWQSELIYQMPEGNIFLGRDRGFNKSKIFVIDRYVPIFDKDAGGRCAFMYLNIFQEIGLQVTFLGENLRKIEPYTTILQQKGIEVLYGDSYKDKLLEGWLKNNLKYFKYIYLQRPDITIKYIDLIKKYSSGKIFYFAHDLHHIRLLREYNLTKIRTKFEESQKMKKIENEIFSKVDVIHVVGTYEYKILKEQYINKTIRNIPLYIYPNQLGNVEKDFSKRKDLIFVGGFEHSPNFDGVIWFSKEVYPKILEKFPDMIWHIISSNTNEIIKKLESKNIKIEGHLSDENLYSLYQKCRIAIAPLRFGAGVKGKVVEAAYNQIPMVTTNNGGEGLDYSIGAFIMEDNPKKMAEIICKLYNDYSKLKQMSNSGKVLIDLYFSKDKAKEIISLDI